METLTGPGPKPVDEVAVPFASVGQKSRWSRRDWLVHKYTGHKNRVKTATTIANGQWMVQWPDLSQSPEAPTVANLIEMGVNHWTAVGGAILPSVRVPVHVTQDRTQGKRGARKRERRLRELWQTSNITETAAQLWGDYALAGSAVLGAWVNFSERDPKKRNPFLMRYDPRTTYLVKDDLGNVVEMLVARKIDKMELKVMLSDDDAARFKDSGPDEVEEWFWFEKDRFFYGIADVGKEGRKTSNMLVLVDEPNQLGFVPVWEAVRPTADGERRGVFDQTVHILRTMHRLMMLTISSTEEHSFPAILEYDTQNPGQFGPGAIIHARSAESRLERIAPGSHFDVKDLVGRLTDQAMQQSVFPQQLSGEPGGSIVSKAGINASMGALDARLALAHKQMETLFGKASGFLLAMDEIFCPGDKEILGDFRDNREAESWNPERDVKGAWVARCTYGIGAGSDPANIEVRLSMHLANGLISKETAREQLPFLEDPDKEPILQMRESMQQALTMSILAKAEQGDPSAAAKALSLLQKDDLDFDAIVEQLVEFLMNPEPEPGAADPALGAVQGAESLMRGGIPGSAEQAPPGDPMAGMGLPPMGQILGQDSRQVI